MNTENNWNDALGNKIEIGSLYGTAYKQNGINYPIFYLVYDYTEKEGYHDTIKKVKVFAFSSRHEKVRRQTIEVLNCLFKIDLNTIGDNKIINELLSNSEVSNFLKSKI